MSSALGSVRLKRRHFLGLGLAAVLPPAVFAAGDPEAYVGQVAKDVLALANSGLGKAPMRQKFTSLLNRYADVRTVAILSLGTYRAQLPPALKDDFYKWTQFYISAFFVFYIDEFQGSTFEVKQTTTQGKFTTVIGTVKQKGGSSQVRWRLTPAGSGYRVHDVNVRGVWLTLQLRKRFTDVLKRSKGDFAPLIEELKKAQSW